MPGWSTASQENGKGGAFYCATEGWVGLGVFLFLKPPGLPRIATDFGRDHAGAAIPVRRVSLAARRAEPEACSISGTPSSASASFRPSMVGGPARRREAL